MVEITKDDWEKKADIIFEMLDGDLTWDEISAQYSVCHGTIFNYRKAAIAAFNDLYNVCSIS